MLTETAYQGSSNVITWYFTQEVPEPPPSSEVVETVIDWTEKGYNASRMELYINNITISSDDVSNPIKYFSDGRVEITLGELSEVFNNRANTVHMKVFREDDVLGKVIVDPLMASSSAKIKTISIGS